MANNGARLMAIFPRLVDAYLSKFFEQLKLGWGHVSQAQIYTTTDVEDLDALKGAGLGPHGEDINKFKITIVYIWF